MNYKFNGRIFKEGLKSFITVPFNVWEECGQKGNISVEVTIDDVSFECKLVPKGKGSYYIPITKSVLKPISENNELVISFKLISGLSRIKITSFLEILV